MYLVSQHFQKFERDFVFVTGLKVYLFLFVFLLFLLYTKLKKQAKTVCYKYYFHVCHYFVVFIEISKQDMYSLFFKLLYFFTLICYKSVLVLFKFVYDQPILYLHCKHFRFNCVFPLFGFWSYLVHEFSSYIVT